MLTTLKAALPGRGEGLPADLLTREVTVDATHLADYAHLCGFTLRDELPPTYPHIMAFPLTMQLLTGPDFPFPLVGIVHLANRITVAGPLDAAARWDFTVHAEDLPPHDRGRQLDHGGGRLGPHDSFPWGLLRGVVRAVGIGPALDHVRRHQ